MDIFIEWRPDDDRDGYRESFVSDQLLDDGSDRALRLRGQVFTYAAHLRDSQHRLFFFAVDIYESRARLYRFDPSCVVISEPIHFREDSRLLDEFFVRYAALPAIQRGHDPAVISATPAEEALFQERIREYFERVKKDGLREHPGIKKLGGRISKVQVNDLNGNTRWYLACKCTTFPVTPLPCGRFSRGYIAINAPIGATASKVQHIESRTASGQLRNEKGKLFWLKDCWRVDSTESEASIYYDLKDRGVPNLPHIECAGDVLFETRIQETANDTLLSDPSADSWRRPTLLIQNMVHHRIVSGVLIPLDHLENVRELLLVGRDILNSEIFYLNRTVLQHCAQFHSCNSNSGRVSQRERLSSRRDQKQHHDDRNTGRS